ncbi:vomeronasal type-1 receptor 4-like [Trichechus inunguis]
MVSNIIKGTIFIFLTAPGILGNISIFVNYVYIFFWGPEKRPILLILIHLAFTNIIILFSKGMTIAAFGLRDFLDYIGCKIAVYIEMVARGLAICTSSLLTMVQAITIKPPTSKWMWLKPKFTLHVLPFFLFFWLLNSLISMNLLYYITNTSSMNISQVSNYDYYCYFQWENQIINWIFVTLMVLRDGLFQCLMGWASCYMVFLLHQHHKHVLYLQTCTKFLYKTPPEIKAAQSVLLLMLCFLFLYWTDCFLSLCLNYSSWNNSLMLNIREFITFGYSIHSPFVLIPRDGHVAKCWHAQ